MYVLKLYLSFKVSGYLTGNQSIKLFFLSLIFWYVLPPEFEKLRILNTLVRALLLLGIETAIRLVIVINLW